MELREIVAIHREMTEEQPVPLLLRAFAGFSLYCVLLTLSLLTIAFLHVVFLDG